MVNETTLNEAQMSVLRLLGSMKTVEEVDELRRVICEYYARRVDEEVDKLSSLSKRGQYYPVWNGLQMGKLSETIYNFQNYETKAIFIFHANASAAHGKRLLSLLY